MNHLSLIKQSIVKRRRLTEAQRLMAKAYRGVEYTDAHHSRPQPKKQSDLKYRGLSYNV